jgi:hypothetical protein
MYEYYTPESSNIIMTGIKIIVRRTTRIKIIYKEEGILRAWERAQGISFLLCACFNKGYSAITEGFYLNWNEGHEKVNSLVQYM